MSLKYTAPDRALSAFHCPFCHVYAAMEWGGAYRSGYFRNVAATGFMTAEPSTAADRSGLYAPNTVVLQDLDWARCEHCKQCSLWYKEQLIVPPVLALGPEPVDELPPDIKADFNEARAIGTRSPRGAAALLRLCIQKLCRHLGETDGNLNNAIRSLVSKGLDAAIVEALDTVRVIGNEAVHPLTMDLKDDVATVERLLELVNYIADAMITQPAKRAALFATIPPSKAQGIQKQYGKA